MNALGIGAERICVIPPALYTAERRRTAAEPSQRSWPVEDGAPLILSVGRRAPYKNLAGLLDAFELLRRQHTAPYRLLIIGPIDPRYRDLEARAERLGLTGQVIFTGYVPDSDLAELYRRASLFVHPSLYEGFGLPVLEAMAAGVPVVSSNRSSLPEVCGEAALLVDPTDTAAMAAAMAQVLSDDQLSARLRREGLLRAKNFTPRIMAERLLKLYIEACGAGAGKK
jgi:glycosyltransferase involved in cell wall biosynthesis